MAGPAQEGWIKLREGRKQDRLTADRASVRVRGVMSKRNKQNSHGKRSGGMMMGMRSGIRKMAGTDGKKAPGGKRKWTFQQVLGIVLGAAAVLFLIWIFTRI